VKRSNARRLLVLLAVTTVGASCASRAPLAVRTGPVGFTETIALPPPVTTGTRTLEDALLHRRSTYLYGQRPVPLNELGQLLWAAQGITGAGGKRTAPSAGGLYPLEMYALTDRHLLHYLPDGHRAERRVAAPWRQRLQAAAFGQKVIGRAPAIIVVAAVPERTRRKYSTRTQSHVDLEAGHAAQNVLLEVTARGLVAVPVGGIDSSSAARVLTLPPGQVVLYLIPVGYPAVGS